MKRNLFTAWVLSLALPGIGSAQGAPTTESKGEQITSAQVKQIVRDGRAPEHYKSLAGYYGERAKTYLQKAAEEKKEWESLSQNVSSAAAKYPRPSDSARNLYEYYTHKASEAGALEAKYSQLASPGALAKAQ